MVSIRGDIFLVWKIGVLLLEVFVGESETEYAIPEDIIQNRHIDTFGQSDCLPFNHQLSELHRLSPHDPLHMTTQILTINKFQIPKFQINPLIFSYIDL